MKRVLIGCVIFRILNSLLVRTYFDPDEYWQATEVAHRLVFGFGHFTWEWACGLRSILHPLFFSSIYYVLKIFKVDSRWMVAWTPRLMQAILAAICDACVYLITKKKFNHNTARFALLCQLTNWFNFFALVRTYGNCMEAALTVVTFHLWPGLAHFHSLNAPKWKRPCAIFLVGICAVVRPTSATLWIPIGVKELLWGPKRLQFFLYEVIPLALIVVGGSTALDTWFYGRSVFPPWQFIKVNQFDKVSLLYGSHLWHWYFTQGLPTVLGPMVILLFVGVYVAKDRKMALWGIWYISVHSLAGHKEFRFIFPAVPLLMPYCGLGLNALYVRLHLTQREPQDEPKKSEIQKSDQSVTPTSHLRQRHGKLLTEKPPKIAGDKTNTRFGRPKRTFKCSRFLWWALVIVCIGIQIPAGLYFALVHQRGSISVMEYLSSLPGPELTAVLFLTPCHFTPLYSHLHRNVPMRFLDCSPPGWDVPVAELNYKFGTTASPAVLRKRECMTQNKVCKSEAETALADPREWLDAYLSSQNEENEFPSHIVVCDRTVLEVQEVLARHNFVEKKSIFRSHFDVNDWNCNRLEVFGHVD